MKFLFNDTKFNINHGEIMGKALKLYKKWTGRIPADVHVQEVITFLNYYFPGMWGQRRGSHIVIRCERLNQFLDYRPNGEITVPIKNGKRVKGFYIKELVKAVCLLDELEDFRWKRT